MSDTSHPKITASHLQREACLYVRQSSLRQVMDNTESGRRQYALNQQALALGWPANRIRVIDEDQGKSGASSENRNGFRDLMGRLANGEVGMVLSLEVSRLARDNADWHQLLRIAGLSNTLILDETGVYDPADSNDRLLLGIKGTLSEFELLGIRARMIGGMRSAAARGALKIGLPTGLVYNENDEVMLDPDQSIIDTIAGVFTCYRRMGSIAATVRWMHQENLKLPSRPNQGCHPAGALRWSLPTVSQIRSILCNPRYAGAYVYGRRRSEKQPDGTVRSRTLPIDEWQVCIVQAHVGFIDWNEFKSNQANLKRNPHPFAVAGAHNAQHPRNGAALLRFPQVICGHCGQPMGPIYKRTGSPQAANYFYQCRGQRQRDAKTDCQCIRGESVDAALSEFAIGLINTENIDLALAVEQLVRVEFTEADAQRAQLIDRLRYQADQAQRRFFAVDPENRLVAASLEADWNNALKQLNHAVAERQARAEQQNWDLSEQQIARVHELTRDFAQVWNASDTQHQDRKQLLGLLIEDVTLLREAYFVTVRLRLRGGLTVTLDPVVLAKPPWLARKTLPETIAEIKKLAPTHLDTEIAEQLNPGGHRTWNNDLYTGKKVQSIRNRNAIPGYLELRRQSLRAQGFVTAGELAAQLGTSNTSVYNWSKSPSIQWLETAVIEARNGKRFNMYKIREDISAAPPAVYNPNTKKDSNFQHPTQGAL